MRPAAGSAGDEGLVGLPPDEPLPIRLMNTIWADRHGVHDALERPAHLARWLAATGVAAHAQVGEVDLERARELRDALRRLAALVTSDDRPPAASALRDPSRAVRAVNAAAERGLVVPRLQVHEGVLGRNSETGGSPVAAALSLLAVESIDLLTGAAAGTLRACHAPGCVLYFVKDHPRREWCSTACGNRARAARHYRRHRVGRAGG
jgi:predicted RNA-binding Zn ribbon-like protein